MRRRLFKEFESLGVDLREEEGRAGEVATRMRQAADEPRRHRVSSCGHDDRNPLGYLYGGAGLRRAVRHDHIDAINDKLARQRQQKLVVSFRGLIL